VIQIFADPLYSEDETAIELYISSTNKNLLLPRIIELILQEKDVEIVNTSRIRKIITGLLRHL
jgi:hypothetical protein